MNISIAGLGIVSKIGGTREIEQYLALEEINTVLLHNGRLLPVVFPDDYGVPEKLTRRMSHFAKLALLSAYHAIRDSGLNVAGKSIGIIQGSVYGPVISGIKAFDDLIDFGDNQLSPVNFSGSVFNTSTSYISLALGIRGCTLSHTGGQDTLYNSLLTAGLWLEGGAADYVIMGIGDEYLSFIENPDPCGDKPGLLPTSEGWTTFILSKNEKDKYGKIEYGLLRELPPGTENQKNIFSVWNDQIKTDVIPYDNRFCFLNFLRGSYPSASAFDLALALICSKNKRFPVNNSSNYNIISLDKNEKISCYNPAETGGIFYYDVYSGC